MIILIIYVLHTYTTSTLHGIACAALSSLQHSEVWALSMKA
jgi:hypothetical protein